MLGRYTGPKSSRETYTYCGLRIRHRGRRYSGRDAVACVTDSQHPATPSPVYIMMMLDFPQPASGQEAKK